MNKVHALVEKIAGMLAHIAEHAKPLFSGAALLFYVGSLVLLVRDVNPIHEQDTFLVEALVRLSIPFSIILLQEILELATMMSGRTLASKQQQFQIVVLVRLLAFGFGGRLRHDPALLLYLVSTRRVVGQKRGRP